MPGEEYVYSKPIETKKSYKKFIIIPVIIIALIAAYFLYNNTNFFKSNKLDISQENVIKDWFGGIIKGDWDTVFTNMVDENNSYYSENCRNRFVKVFNSWVGATNYSFKIKEIKSCKDSVEYKNIAKNFRLKTTDDCIVAYNSYLLKMQDQEEGQENNFWFLVKIEDKWKIQILCGYLPE